MPCSVRCLSAVAQGKFGEHPSDVGLDGALADEELGGDLGVGLPADDVVEDLPFPVGEPFQLGVAGLAGAGEVLDQPAGDCVRVCVEARLPILGLLISYEGTVAVTEGPA